MKRTSRHAAIWKAAFLLNMRKQIAMENLRARTMATHST